MPHVRNLADQEFNLRIGRAIPALGEIEVSDEEAAVLAGHPLLEMVDDKPARKTPPATKEGD